MAKPTAEPHDPAEPSRHLLDLGSLPADRIRAILASARAYAEAPPARRWDTLTGRFVANLFFEPSTRTRLSFTIAARRLGAEVVDLTSATSSVLKGETIADTARTVQAMGVSAIVVRHGASGAAELVADAVGCAVGCAVINAGDGRHAHPTQALIDAYTVAEAHDRLAGFDLSGLRVGVVGDLTNSRVARSDIAAFTALGAEVVCIGPERLAPRAFESLGCAVGHDLDPVLPNLDALQMLRVQTERGADAGKLREYPARFGLDDARVERLKPSAVILHPGPINRGAEITSAVVDSPRCLALRQVALGVPVRMASIAHALGR